MPAVGNLTQTCGPARKHQDIAAFGCLVDAFAFQKQMYKEKPLTLDRLVSNQYRDLVRVREGFANNVAFTYTQTCTYKHTLGPLLQLVHNPCRR